MYGVPWKISNGLKLIGQSLWMCLKLFCMCLLSSAYTRIIEMTINISLFWWWVVSVIEMNEWHEMRTKQWNQIIELHKINPNQSVRNYLNVREWRHWKKECEKANKTRANGRNQHTTQKYYTITWSQLTLAGAQVKYTWTVIISTDRYECERTERTEHTNSNKIQMTCMWTCVRAIQLWLWLAQS